MDLDPSQSPGSKSKLLTDGGICLNVEVLGDEEEDAIGEHLDADEADEHAAESFDGDEPLFSEELFDVGAEEDNDERGNPGGEGGASDQENVASLMGVEHDRGDGSGAGDDRDGQRDDHRLVGEGFCAIARFGFRENHGEGDEEEENPSGNGDDRAGDPQNAQNGVAEKGEEEEDRKGDGQLAGDDFELPSLIEASEHREEEGDLTGCVQYKKDRCDNGKKPYIWSRIHGELSLKGFDDISSLGFLGRS